MGRVILCEPILAYYSLKLSIHIVYRDRLRYFLYMVTALNNNHETRLLAPSMLACKAACLEYFDVQAGVSLAVWRNQTDQVHAENPSLHTLSLYLEGGSGTYRLDKRERTGGPGKVSLLPAGHASDWLVDQPLRLIHLYFTEQHLDYLRLTAFDMDPRLSQLADLTFESDPRLVASLSQFYGLMHSDTLTDKLLLQELQQQLLVYLLEQYSKRTAISVKGGLAPYRLAHVRDYIQANLSNEISLSELAEVACSSTYHFARMFRQSVGLSPYQYVLRQRLQLAQQLIASGLPLSDVMDKCGYANHSRFARAFSQQYGVTPGAYQSYCGANVL